MCIPGRVRAPPAGLRLASGVLPAEGRAHRAQSVLGLAAAELLFQGLWRTRCVHPSGASGWAVPVCRDAFCRHWRVRRVGTVCWPCGIQRRRWLQLNAVVLTLFKAAATRGVGRAARRRLPAEVVPVPSFWAALRQGLSGILFPGTLHFSSVFRWHPHPPWLEGWSWGQDSSGVTSLDGVLPCLCSSFGSPAGRAPQIGVRSLWLGPSVWALLCFLLAAQPRELRGASDVSVYVKGCTVHLRGLEGSCVNLSGWLLFSSGGLLKRRCAKHWRILEECDWGFKGKWR